MPETFGRYELVERISAGGMAEVFKARTSGAAGFEKVVAIKRILPQFSEDDRFVDMFIEEARISANLNHANIGQVYDFGEIDGTYFIAMEYVRGRDLSAILKLFRSARTLLPLPMAIRIGLDICSALHYAHTKLDASGRLLRIVHRDVSPPNILISFEGSVKLIDFGIAKALATSPQTGAKLLKGKYGYLSPEQADGKDIDGRSDIFSLGAVLFELLTGERLFADDDNLIALAKVRRAEVPSITRLNPKVSPALEAVVRKCLARAPSDRYQRAEEAYEALDTLARGSGLTYSALQLSNWMLASFEATSMEATPFKSRGSASADLVVSFKPKAPAGDEQRARGPVLGGAAAGQTQPRPTPPPGYAGGEEDDLPTNRELLVPPGLQGVAPSGPPPAAAERVSPVATTAPGPEVVPIDESESWDDRTCNLSDPGMEAQRAAVAEAKRRSAKPVTDQVARWEDCKTAVKPAPAPPPSVPVPVPPSEAQMWDPITEVVAEAVAEDEPPSLVVEEASPPTFPGKRGIPLVPETPDGPPAASDGQSAPPRGRRSDVPEGYFEDGPTTVDRPVSSDVLDAMREPAPPAPGSTAEVNTRMPSATPHRPRPLILFLTAVVGGAALALAAYLVLSHLR